MRYYGNKPYLLNGYVTNDFVTYDRADLDKYTLRELQLMGRLYQIDKYNGLAKRQLIDALLKIQKQEGRLYKLLEVPQPNRNKGKRLVRDATEFKEWFNLYFAEQAFMEQKHYDKEGNVTHVTKHYGIVTKSGFAVWLGQRGLMKTPSRWLKGLPDDLMEVWEECIVIMQHHLEKGIAVGDIPTHYGIHVGKAQYNQVERVENVNINQDITRDLTNAERRELEAVINGQG